MAKHRDHKQGWFSLLFRKRRPQSNKQRILTAIFLFAIAGLLLFPESAAALTAEEIVNTLASWLTQVLLVIARIFMQMTVFALKMFIELAKYNGYVDAPVVIIGWTMVRDIANMFFVIVLLAIAFGTILGLEQYEWKKTLVNFILAAVFVNFSKMIAGLFIDAAHVFTITFLNAIVATAGGNVISMFHLNSILKFVGQDLSKTNLAIEIFGGGVLAIVFAGMAMMTMLAYLVVMLNRLVMLWVLIILSPLAYLLNALPQTKSYAQEWWSEFGKHVMVAPMMVFFLWLAFAALGSGNFAGPDLNLSLEGQQETAAAIGGGQTSVSINQVSTWENMANFFIAIAFLMAGIERVQKLGVRGGSATQSAIDFGKKVGTIASGYAAGRWLVGKGADIGLKGAGKAGMFLGGDRIVAKAKNIGEDIKKYYYGKGYEPTEKSDQLGDELVGKTRELNKIQNIEDAIAGKQRELDVATTDEQRQTIERDMAVLGESLKAATGGSVKEGKQRLLDEMDDLEKEIDKEIGGGFLQSLKGTVPGTQGPTIVGWLARRNISAQKQLAKTTKQAENRREILWKRTGSESGSILSHLDQGKVFGKQLFKHGTLFGKFGDRYGSGDAQDRIERGWLAAEKMRSAAKDKEYETRGMKQALNRARLKFDVNAGKLRYEGKSGSVLDRISGHEMMADYEEAAVQRETAAAKIRISLDNLSFKKKDELDENGNKIKFTEDMVKQEQARAKAMQDQLSRLDERELSEKMKDLYAQGTGLDELAEQLASGAFDDEMQTLLDERGNLDDQATKERSDALSSELQELKDAQEARNEAQKKVGGIIADDAKIGKLQTEAANLESVDVAALNADETTKHNEKVEDMNRRIAAATAERAAKVANLGDREDVDQLINDFNTADADLVAKRNAYSAAEKALREDETSQYGQLMAQLKEKDAVIDERKESEFRPLADRLRSGDMTVLDNVLDKLADRIGRETDDKKRKSLELVRSDWQKLKGVFSDATLAYGYGKQAGLNADMQRGLKYSHNLLLSEAEQREVFDARGLSTPKTTLNELIEEYSSAFGEMSVDDYVANAGSMLTKMLKRKKQGKLNQQDQAALMGLFKRGVDRAWIDDTITAIMNNEEARELIGEELGWTNDTYRDEKIRDIQMLFATGANVDAVRKNAVITTIKDVAIHDHGIKDNGKLLEMIRSGEFRDANGTDITSQLKGTIDAWMKKRKTQFADTSKAFADSQKDLFESVFKGADAAADSMRKTMVEDWLNVMKQNKSEMQFLGNLRPDALKGGHVENAGHALARDVGGGQTMYVGMGIRSAKAHVLGDWRKMTARDRLQAQSHCIFELTASHGQVPVGIQEEELLIFGDGLEPRNVSQLNVRMRKHLRGVSEAEKKQKLRKGGYYEGDRILVDGKLTVTAKGIMEKIEEEEPELWAELQAAQNTNEQQAVVSKFVMNKVYEPVLRLKPELAIAAMADGAGVNPTTALLEGTINRRMYNPRKGEWVEYSKVNALIKDLKNGDWLPKSERDRLDAGDKEIKERLAKIGLVIPGKAPKDLKEKLDSGEL